MRSAYIHGCYLDWTAPLESERPTAPGDPVPALPSLVSSIDGAIARLFLTLPWWLFEPERDPDAAVPKYRALVAALLTDLPAATRYTLLVNRRCRAALERWLERLGAAGRCSLIEAPDDRRFTLWAEDAFGVCRERETGAPWIVTSSAGARLDDPECGPRLALDQGFGGHAVPFALGGGNALVGDDFWLIGADTPRHSLERGRISVRAGESWQDAAQRAYRATLDAERRLFFVGCAQPLAGFAESYLERPAEIGGRPGSEVVFRGNEAGTHQPIYHIDLFVSLAGRDPRGRFVILVGDPRLGAELAGLPLPHHAQPAAFDEIAAQLASVPDFRVLRNPLPPVYVDEPGEPLREWYFASANNVLVQDAPAAAGGRAVWLPTYGHPPWPELAACDEVNAAIWAALGFQVQLLPDCHPMAYSLGGPNCVKKLLARGTGPGAHLGLARE